MEAVPRLPMLAFELKHSPEYVDFGPTLKKFIREHYGEDPAAYNKNFSDLDQLRQNAIHVTRDFVGCSTLKKYYAQLQLLNGRFPMGEGGEAAVTFTWEDNQTGRDHIFADIKFEQACILYNIGALHSNLGAIDTRQNAEGMKVSCTHFQCAAWAFEHLRDHFGSSGMSTDMAHEYLTFHVSVMLAQAQECILEKSMVDSRKNTITAKVAAQVVEFYQLSVKNLDQCNTEQIINSRSYKDWKKRIELKIAFYQCITHYYMGKQSEDQQKWGERLAYLQAAQEKLSESIKLAKNEVPEMQEALRFAQDVVGGKLQSAQKDNDFVYHEKIPPLDSLPEVKGAPLVKGIPFDPTDVEISGPDLFQKLVPMEAHEASSVYSEEKAKLLRAVMEDVETANTELEQFMSSLQIDPSMFEQLPDRLPQDLLEKCAAMSVRTNAIKDLVDSMSGVSGLATEAEMNIKEIQDILAEDSRRTEEFEKQFGKKMVSSVLPGLAKDCEAYVEKHTQGSQLNSSLHTAMNAHISKLKMLAMPPEQLQAQLPPAQPPKSAEDEEVMSEMRRMLKKVEEMKMQRATLEKQFRDDIQKDDITTVLMATDNAKESVFKDQLKKYDTLINYIGQNLNAQSNVLRVLTDANAKFAPLRQAIGQQSVEREGMIKDLISSFETYEELLAKSKKGEDYYSRLNETVTKTLERCRSECKVRQEERDMITSKYAPKAPPPSRPTAPKPGQTDVPTTPTSTLPPALDPRSFMPGMVPPGPTESTALPTFEGPKLKDFLPFMKPQSFGPKSTLGSKTASQSPQNLPPGSPDPMMSGPPSLASSASDSPQHRSVTNLPSHTEMEQLPPVGPHGVVSRPFATPGSASDVASSDHLPSARPSRPDTNQSYGAPPDVTANLPVDRGLQPQPGSLPDVFNLPSAKDGFSLPPHMAGHSQLGGYRGSSPATARVAGSDASGLSSSSESLASTGSYQHGYLPPRQTDNRGQLHSPESGSSTHSMPLGPPASVPQHPQQFQPGAGVQPPPQTGLPAHYPAAHGVHSQQARPSPSPSPASLPTSAVSVPGYPQPAPQVGYNQGSHSLPQVPPVRPGTMPQQVPSHLHDRQFQQPFPQQHPHQPPPCEPQQTPHLAQQYYYRGAQPHQIPGQQQAPQAQHPQQQVGVQPSMRPAGSESPQLPPTALAYSQPGQVPGVVRPPAPGQPLQQPSGSSAASVSVSAYGQQPYNTLSSGVYSQYSATSTPSQQTLSSSGQAFNAGQGVPGQHFPATSVGTYPVSVHQPHTSQNQPQQQGQIVGMMPQGHTQTVTASQPPASSHSQLPASIHPVPLPHQLTMQTQQQHGHGQANQNIGQGQPQGQGQLPSQGQAVRGLFVPGTQSQLNMAGTGVYSQSGHYPSPALPPVQPQTGHPSVHPQLQQQHPQQGLPQHQQQSFPPHQQRQATTNSYQAGYSQGPQSLTAQPAAPGMLPQPAANFAGQRFSSVPQQGLTSKDQMFPGQPGYIPGSRLQQLPQQSQQQFPQQQQIPQQHSQQQQQFPPQPQVQKQQHFPQQHAQNQQQQFPQQQQHQYPDQQKQQLPQQQFPPQHRAQAQHAQQQMYSQPHPQQGQQVRPYSHQQHLPSGQQPQQQLQQQTFPQYPGQQPQSQPQPHLPHESQLIFPTPLQPSRVQPADTVQPGPPSSPASGGGVGMSSLPANSTLQSPAGPADPQSSPNLSVHQNRASSMPRDQQSGSAPSSQTNLLPGSLLTRQESSLDELLSSSPEGSKHTAIPAPIITPKVLTDQEKQQQKEEAVKKGAIVEAVKDPYANSSVLNKLVSDVETFGKFVDDLSISILGVSRLDTVWKSLIDSQDHDVKKQSIAIARCYPMKNRDPDIMPYDDTRVVLTTTKDDYINASWINDLAPSCPKFVATQAPLNVTMTDFWAMVYELGSEVIVQITSEYETGKKFPVYFPMEKGQQMEQGPMIVNLQSVKYRQLWTERNIYLKHSQTKQARTVIHLQFKTWPVSGFPDEVQHIVRFISEVHNFYQQQRSLLKPVIVHCGNGVGRTGAFLTIYTSMQEMLHGNGLTDVPALAKRVLQKRKNLIHKKEQLKFCYDALLCFAEDFLKKRNILVQHPHFEKKAKIADSAPTTSTSDDIVLGSVNLHTLQQTVGRLHVSGEGEKGGTSLPSDPSVAHTVQRGKESQPISALPDLIQQQSHSDAGIAQSGGGGGSQSTNQVSSSVHGAGSGTEGLAEFTRSHSRSGSNASQHSLASMTDCGSSRGSPQHAPGSFSHSPSPSSSMSGGVSQSLADLQDPTKFTIGKGEQKKRFHKASFERKGSGAGIETKPDPSDPLSSLDPMWSIHKPPQSDK